jgi:hypothetical protein
MRANRKQPMCETLRALMIGVLTIAAPLSQSVISRSEEGQPPNSHVIFEGAAFSQIDGDVGPGGYESASSHKTRRYTSQINNCLPQIRAIGLNWVQTNGLEILSRNETDSSFYLHVNVPKQNGFYELLYRVQNTEVHVSLQFIEPNGREVQPDSSLLGITELVQKLDEALTCK